MPAQVRRRPAIVIPVASPARPCRPGLAAVGLLLVAFAPAPGGEVFKWRDEDGNVYYSDRAPAESAQRLELEAPPPPDPGLDRRRQRRERLLETLAEERERERRQARQAAERRRERERRCAEARSRLEEYLTANYLYDEDAQGNRSVLSDAEHAAVRAEARAQVRRYCDD